MKNKSFTDSFKGTGLECKQAANSLPESLDEEAYYAGSPSVGYQAAGWGIDRESIVIIPEIQKNTLRRVSVSRKMSTQELKCHECRYSVLTADELVDIGSDPCLTCDNLSNWKERID